MIHPLTVRSSFRKLYKKIDAQPYAFVGTSTKNF